MFFGKKGAFSVCSLISKNRCAKAVENSNFIKLRSSDSQKINFKFFNKNSSPKNFSNVNQNSSAKNYSFIFKGSLFTAAFLGTAFSAAVIIKYERLQAEKQRSILSGGGNSSKFSELRIRINVFWNSISEVNKAALIIIFLNTLVLGAWKIRGAQDIMKQFFVLIPQSGRYSQFVLSTFSHQSLFHVGFNMLALYSMSGLLTSIMPMEQFVAFFLSAGVFSALTSSIFRILNSTAFIGSLGASGSIISCFSLCSFVYPDTKFFIFFIPYPIEAETLLKALVTFDLAGLVLGYKRIDHAAHLGGALFAYIYITYGPKVCKKFQNEVLKLWKEIRN